MELDENFFNRLLNADFFEKDGMIFVKDLLRNFDSLFEKMQKDGKNKEEIEKSINHITMEFVSTHQDKQEAYAKQIAQAWENTLESKFPKKRFKVEFLKGDLYLHTVR